MNNFFAKNYARTSSHLGGVYPFISESHPTEFFFEMDEVINLRKSIGLKVELDPVALATKACFPYLLGDRTLISGVSRAPWMHSFKEQTWVKENLPMHGRSFPKPNEHINRLKSALLEEARSYICEAKTVGILLSGGMDSRVVAGIVRELQLNHLNINVVGITWGLESSRDVIYSKEICKLFGWDFIHKPITAETLFRNIGTSAAMGAEVSALHYHCMPEVAELIGIDIILAGSYGDSVGRAEFSGKHVSKITSILPKKFDQFGLLNNDFLKNVNDQIISDSELNKDWSSNDHSMRQYEIEQECFYMRRMLQSCMQVIASKTPLFQMFTSPEVFGLMWSLEPTVRDNSWYFLLLQSLPGNLLSIPWARTGTPYNSQAVSKADSFDKRYHKYGYWLRNDLKSEVLSLIESSEIFDLKIFNERSLKCLIYNWGRSNEVGNNKVDEFITWLASLGLFIKNHDLSCPSEKYPISIKDQINSAAAFSFGFSYITARNLTKK